MCFSDIKFEVVKLYLKDNKIDDKKISSLVHELKQNANILKDVKNLNKWLSSNCLGKILQTKWWDDNLKPEEFYRKKQNPNSFEWKLYFEIVKKMKEIAGNNNAKLAIFNETDIGQFNWEKYWCGISVSQENIKNYLSHYPLLKKFATSNDILLVENKRPYKRANNDPHSNELGNKMMALDIYDFVVKNFSLPKN